MSTDRQSPVDAQGGRPVLWDAGRGAVVGVVVYAVWFGRPWLVSGLGFLCHVLCCAIAAASGDPASVLLGAAASALAYAASAAAVGYGARTPPPAGPARRSDA